MLATTRRDDTHDQAYLFGSGIGDIITYITRERERTKENTEKTERERERREN